MNRLYPRWSLDEYEALRPKLDTLSDDSIAVVRQVLVEGRTSTTVAKERGVSASAITKTVRKALALVNGAPAGFVEVREFFPPEIAAQLREYAAQLQATEGKKRQIAAIDGPNFSKAGK